MAYFTRYEDVKLKIKEHEANYRAKFVTNTDSGRCMQKEITDYFGSDKNVKIWWNDPQAKTCKHPIETSGVPFVSCGVHHQECEFGALRSGESWYRKKRKDDPNFRPRRKRTSKKVGCPAVLFCRHIIVFPEYKMEGLSSPTQRQHAGIKIRQRLLNSQPVKHEHRWYLAMSDHTNHPEGRTPDTGQVQNEQHFVVPTEVPQPEPNPESPESVLLIEPFYGGSHKQLIDVLEQHLPDCAKYTLTGKKWHWRARTSALYFAQNIPLHPNGRVLFCSSVLNLAEFVALRPDLATLKKVVYFHENQLTYPVRKQQDRDFQYGYNQVLTCLCADQVVFNSQYNMESFLTSISSFMKTMPDHRPKGLSEQIRPKCRVIYFPVDFSKITEDPRLKKTQTSDAEIEQNKTHTDASMDIQQEVVLNQSYLDIDMLNGHENIIVESVMEHVDELAGNVDMYCQLIQENGTHIVQIMPPSINDIGVSSVHSQTKVVSRGAAREGLDHEYSSVLPTVCDPVHVVWPHRWEHDKDPDSFFEALFALSEEGLDFHLSVLGEMYTEVPEIFETAKSKLSKHIKQWGYQSSKTVYYQCLQQADVVVSTAKHEFFGVAMLEAVYCGCYPICPNSLVYPEIFPAQHLFNTQAQLVKKLRQFFKRPDLLRKKLVQMDLTKYSWQSLSVEYMDLLGAAAAQAAEPEWR